MPMAPAMQPNKPMMPYAFIKEAFFLAFYDDYPVIVVFYLWDNRAPCIIAGDPVEVIHIK